MDDARRKLAEMKIDLIYNVDSVAAGVSPSGPGSLLGHG